MRRGLVTIPRRWLAGAAVWLAVGLVSAAATGSPSREEDRAQEQLENLRQNLETWIARQGGYDAQARQRLWSVNYELRRLDDLLRMIEEEPDSAMRTRWRESFDRLARGYGVARVRPVGAPASWGDWRVAFVRVLPGPYAEGADPSDRFVRRRFEDGLRASLESDPRRPWSGDLPVGRQTLLVRLDPWATGLSYRCRPEEVELLVQGASEVEVEVTLEPVGPQRWLLYATWGVVLLAPLAFR